jgi:hypothetical protein
VTTNTETTAAEFRIRNLSVLAYAQGFTQWHYKHGGVMRDALAPGFFNSAAELIATGDMVLVSCRDGGAMLFIEHSDDAATVRTEPMCATAVGRS